MTESKVIPTEPHIMRLSFDVDQLSQSLRYEFFDPDGNPKHMDQDGLNAGSFYFNTGDEIKVEIQATHEYTAGIAPKLKLTALNCAFVFIGRVDTNGNQPDLSPFEPTTASFNISEKDFDEGKLVRFKDPKRVRVRRLQNGKHIVTASDGQWAMSGYLSVSFKAPPFEPTGGTPPTRFFSFDPETSAGSGPNEPDIAGYNTVDSNN